MSIYGTWLMFDTDHEDDCAVWVKEDDCWHIGDAPCDCGTPNAPIIYEGSHVLPSDDDRRGGWLEVGAIPGFITRDGRDDGNGLWDWLRIGIGALPSLEQYQGKPYMAAGQATVVLTRRQVQQLRDTLTSWLEREPDHDE